MISHTLVSISVRREVFPRVRGNYEITLSGGIEYLSHRWIDDVAEIPGHELEAALAALHAAAADKLLNLQTA